MTDIFTPEQRRTTADRVCDLLQSDDRIEGVVMVGSMAQGPDRWSDVDIAVAVAEHANADAVARDWVARMYEELATLHHYEVAFGDTLVRGFLLEDLLEIDLSFTSVDEFTVWGPARLVFDRAGAVKAAVEATSSWAPSRPEWPAEAGFAWHDIVHAAIAARRGRLWQSLWYMERVRNRTLALSSQRRGWYADFFDYVDDLPAAEREPLESTLVSSLDPDDLFKAIEVATQAFIAELHIGEPTLARRLEGPLLAFVRAVPTL